MDWIKHVIDIVLHLDRHLNEWAGFMGGWMYVLLGAVIFAETGLVVMPFLPGDSLLFAVGALAGTDGSPINVWLVGALLTVCAIAGDAVNYSIGKYVGPKVFSRPTGTLLNRKHLEAAQRFYEKHGGKTIIIARFVPIIRTFAPFVAGIGKMGYARFAAYNVIGGFAWIWAFLLAGYMFGQQPIVKKNFTLVILAVIVISLVPVAVEFIKAKREAKRGVDPLVRATSIGEKVDGE